MIANLSCPENISKLYVDKQDTGGKKVFVFPHPKLLFGSLWTRYIKVTYSQ